MQAFGLEKDYEPTLSTPFEIIGLIGADEITLSNKFKKLRHRLLNVGMNTRPMVFKYLGERRVEINGERLEYERTTRYVVHNQKTKRYAMFLGRGMNAFMCVQPIRKNGQISRSKPFWTHSGNLNR